MSKQTNNVSSSSTGGIGFFGLLTIVFITLKLTKVIDWSWWLVLSPAIFITTLITLLIVAVIAITIWLD